MNLLPDNTFYFQLVIFLGVLFSLNFLLFKPALRVMDKRKAATEGVREEIEGLYKKTAERAKEYEEKMAQAKVQGLVLKNKVRKEGEEAAQKILAGAKEKSEKYLGEMQSKLTQEQSEARLKIRKDVESLGKGIAEEILDRKIG